MAPPPAIPPPIAPPPNFLVRPPFFIGGAPAPAARAFSSATTRGSTPEGAPCAAAILARMSAAMRGSTAGAAAGAPRPAIILARSSAATRGSTPPAAIIGPPSIFLVRPPDLAYCGLPSAMPRPDAMLRLSERPMPFVILPPPGISLCPSAWRIKASLDEPPSIFFVRPPAFMPPTCFGPSRYSLAFFLSTLMNRSTGGISALPPALRGLRTGSHPSRFPIACSRSTSSAVENERFTRIGSRPKTGDFFS